MAPLHGGDRRPFLLVFRPKELSAAIGYTTQFLRNSRSQNAFQQAELILYAALDPAIASRARKGEFVQCFDHFGLLQTPIN
jgi:hypothetical protein